MDNPDHTSGLMPGMKPGSKVLASAANQEWARRIYSKLLLVVPALWTLEGTVNLLADEEIVLDLQVLVLGEGYRRLQLTQYVATEHRRSVSELEMEIGVYRDWGMAEALRYQTQESCETVYSGPEGTADRRYYLHGNALLEKWLEALAGQRDPLYCL